MIDMPKKLPMNIKKTTEVDSNCKRSCLRNRIPLGDIKKDCSSPMKCKQYAQKIKTELQKEDPIGTIISDLNGYITKFNGKFSKQFYQKLGERPLKCLNMNNSFSKKFNNNSSTAMAVDLDHRYINCSESFQTQMSLNLEIKHLKELNLCHLDIIEKQANEILSKTNQIKSLEEDNKNLQAKVKKYEKSLSTNLQKKPVELSSISVKTELEHDESCPCCRKADQHSPKNCQKFHSARSPRSRNSSGKDEIINNDSNSSNLLKKDISRKCSPRHHSSVNLMAPSSLHTGKVGEKRLRSSFYQNGSSSSSSFETSFSLSSEDLLDDREEINNQEICLRKIRSPPQKRSVQSSEELVSPLKKLKSCDANSEKLRKTLPTMPSIEPQEEVTNHSLRSRESRNFEDTPEIPASTKIPVPTKIPAPTKIPVPTKIPAPTKILASFKILDSPTVINGGFSSCSSIEIVTAPSLNESMLDENKSSICITSKSENNEPEKLKLKNEFILTTSNPYYLPTQSAAEFEEVLLENGKETQVELHKWRIKPFSSLYVMEGTENLEDEIFLKRHSKPETEEKRRKRWDLQRMREQRQYEKLKERYEARSSTSDCNCSDSESLWPRPETVTSILVEQSLPVCAFVPWLTGRSPAPVGLSTRKKKVE